MNKKITYIIIAAVVLLGIAWYWYNRPAPEPVASDNTEVIAQDLRALDVGDLEAEFQSIDQDLQAL